METIYFRLTTSVLVAFILVTAIASCQNDNEESPAIKNKDAGTFIIKNLSTQKAIAEYSEVINRDTILIAFRPNQKYFNSHFSIKCEGLDRINDSLFILPKDFFDNGVTIKGDTIIVSKPKDIPNSIAVKVSATGSVSARSDKGSDDFIQADSTFTLIIAKSYALIPLQVGLSSDLLSLVDVEVSYTDLNGMSQKHRVKDHEWVKTYKSNDTFLFSLNARFLNIKGKEMVTTFTANYLPKEKIELDKDTYNLLHDLSMGEPTVFIPGLTVININHSTNWGLEIDDCPEYASEDVTAYLEELSNNPDVKRFKLSTSGNIEEVK